MKRVLSFLILALFVSAVSAQDRDWNFALCFNPQLSWFKADNQNISNVGVRPGFSYGIVVDRNFADNYALSVGAFLNYNGGKLETTYGIDSMPGLNFKITDRYRLQYIELPVGFKLKTNEIGYVTYWGQIGLTNFFNIRARGFRDVDNAWWLESYENKDVRSDILFYNLGIHVGGGIQYSLSGKTSILAGLFFTNGFINVVDDKDGDKVAQNIINLRAGIIF